jgi:16S rRNA processing protein RimM
LDNYFQIGIIVKPQGVKGELRVLPTTDDPGRFDWLDEVTVCTPGANKVYAIESVRLQKNMVILQLYGINDRDAAQALVNARILIPPEQALPLDADEYFVRDLIGLRVYEKNGQQLGILTQVIETGANDVYVVKTTDDKELLLPAVKSCVLSVCMADKKMVVHVMDGLMP